MTEQITPDVDAVLTRLERSTAELVAQQRRLVERLHEMAARISAGEHDRPVLTLMRGGRDDG